MLVFWAHFSNIDFSLNRSYLSLLWGRLNTSADSDQPGRLEKTSQTFTCKIQTEFLSI